jgi:UDP-glucose-4-epimerase GalE
MSLKVLVVGGAGYIGSHVCKALAERGDTPIVLDNLSRGHRHAVQWGPLVEGDIRNGAILDTVLAAHEPDAVMHFAANIEVGEGQRDPVGFWVNNVGGTINLVDAMRRFGLHHIVFSSTCAVYGEPQILPIRESESRSPVNVYGQTKLAVEQMLADTSAHGGIHYAALRYFNAAGASPDGEIGEEHDPETHLIPNALKAAAGLGPPMKLFGDDYDTPDGTCVRDYIHVVDLARAHLLALDGILAGTRRIEVNLGSGRGVSVREVLTAVERVTGHAVPHEVCPRRAGDPPSLYADPAKAKDTLGFETQCSDIEGIIEDAWRFHSARWNTAAGCT